ncbi:V-type ATP synthase subunit E family protein [Ruminococcus sp.]|uniref:V-type ATP synthase subunit E n=1 Tax=Ruminococcus sp. TaxID=41978 RepID=UPI0025D2F3BE|nr:V-type ATP synthase subunit E family protein [Ruminococcus sp.]MCR4638081.1 H(+)-transporting ATPase [Ruminococcus sp.]
MSGLDEILNLIETQQRQGEEMILKAAKSKAEAIKAEGDKKAQTAYEDFMHRSKEQAEKDYENACNSVDADMKRRVLACKVELIDEAVEKTVAKLKALPDSEYFDLMIKLAERHSQPENGVLSFCRKDLARVPSDFESKLNECVKKKGGSISLSKAPADIEDGFVLSYGLISENCSFRAIIESEKDEIRDTAARVLFGR